MQPNKSYTPNYNDKSYLQKERNQWNVRDYLNQGYSFKDAHLFMSPTGRHFGAEYAQRAGIATPDLTQPPKTITEQDILDMGFDKARAYEALNDPIDTSRPYSWDANGKPVYENSNNKPSLQTQTYILNGQTLTTKPGEAVPVGGTKISDSTGTYQQVSQPIISSGGKSPLELTKAIQGVSQATPFTLTKGNLKQGSADSADTKQLQTLLGITSDGIFGPQTKASVIAFQKANGLIPDGIVGTKTMAALNAKSGGTTTETATPATPATTSTQARTTTKEAEMTKIKEELEQDTKQPDIYKSSEEFQKLRKEKGVVNDEEELASIQNEVRMAKEELNQFKQTSSKELSQGGYLGGISEAERNLNFRMSSLGLREQSVISRLNNKNTYINTVVGLGKEDYQTAKTAYDDEFNKNLKIMDIYNSELDDEKKDALTAFTTMTNLLGESGISKLTPELSTQLDTLALKAGLPTGVLQTALSGISANEKISNMKIIDNGNRKDVYMMTTGADGIPRLKLVQSVASVNKTSSEGGDADTDVDTYAQSYIDEQIDITGVPQKIRAKVLKRANELADEAIAETPSEEAPIEEKESSWISSITNFLFN